MRTGITQVPLHGGQCPPWLFEKMRRLAAIIIEVIIYEYGTMEVLCRLSDPVWFQTFGCVLGFDWHSSGLTTVVCGAIKDGLYKRQGEIGVFFAGGKGKTSRKTPQEIQDAGERYGLSNDLQGLQKISRLVAKIDSAAVQDGYQLYHHFFAFDTKGNWAVVQQGMNENNRYARRYHWLSQDLKSYVEDPHKGICGIPCDNTVLNLVSGNNRATRIASLELCKEKPEKIFKIISSINKPLEKSSSHEQLSFWANNNTDDGGVFQEGENTKVVKLVMPAYHQIPATNYLNKILYKIYDKAPQNYESLIEEPGVGPGTLRALAMVAEVTHGTHPTFSDPVRYSFAHGGKDGFPFPVNRKDLEHSITVMRKALEKGKMGECDKLDALRRLAKQEIKWEGMLKEI